MSSLYEIVELPNGEIALQRADDKAEGASEPLVSIRFSEESLYFLNDAKLDVAKAMIEAGLEAAGDVEAGEAAAIVHEETNTGKTLH